MLFSHLSVYKPYPPLSIGWRMGLVQLSSESNNGTVVWEFDEVFNAGEKHVINSAIRNGVKNGLSDPELDYDFGLLNSPRRFGRYTAEEVVMTMQRLVKPLNAAYTEERVFPMTQAGVLLWAGARRSPDTVNYRILYHVSYRQSK